jgi:hypothetical protein
MRSCHCIHHRSNVAEFALGRVIGVIPTGAEATPVHREDGELSPHIAHQGSEHGVVTHRAMHQYEGGPSPSTQTAIDPPSPGLTSQRSATLPILRCSDH